MRYARFTDPLGHGRHRVWHVVRSIKVETRRRRFVDDGGMLDEDAAEGMALRIHCVSWLRWASDYELREATPGEPAPEPFCTQRCRKVAGLPPRGSVQDDVFSAARGLIAAVERADLSRHPDWPMIGRAKAALQRAMRDAYVD